MPHTNTNNTHMVVYVSLASILQKVKTANNKNSLNPNVSFGLVGGKNPFELSDQRAYDLYAMTYISFTEQYTTDDGLDISMPNHFAFSEGLESYLDNHLFSQVKSYLPKLTEDLAWQLQQVSIENIDPQTPYKNPQNEHLLPLLSGQLMPFETALSVLLSENKQERFCLLYTVVTDDINT